MWNVTEVMDFTCHTVNIFNLPLAILRTQMWIHYNQYLVNHTKRTGNQH